MAELTGLEKQVPFDQVMHKIVHLEWNVSNMILLVNHKGLKVVLITIVELMLMMYNHKHKHKNQDGEGIDDKN